MTTPLAFQSAAPRHGLPLLFSAQAQKEIVVNEAFARIDTLLHLAVSGERNEPPVDPAEGACWLIGSEPTGAWADSAGAITCFTSGDWLMLSSRSGMRCFDIETGETLLYVDGWVRPGRPQSPAGGEVVDAEARQAIDDLIDSLATLGIFRK